MRQRLSRSRGELLASIERTPAGEIEKPSLLQFAGDQDLAECRSIVGKLDQLDIKRRIGSDAS